MAKLPTDEAPGFRTTVHRPVTSGEAIETTPPEISRNSMTRRSFEPTSGLTCASALRLQPSVRI